MIYFCPKCYRFIDNFANKKGGIMLAYTEYCAKHPDEVLTPDNMRVGTISANAFLDIKDLLQKLVMAQRVR